MCGGYQQDPRRLAAVLLDTKPAAGASKIRKRSHNFQMSILGNLCGGYQERPRRPAARSQDTTPAARAIEIKKSMVLLISAIPKTFILDSLC